MVFEIKTKSVYIGNNTTEFNSIRDAFDTAGIAYNYKVRNHQDKLLMPGTGTVRGRFGSIGVNLELANEYEIKVSQKDVEVANFIINKLKRDSKKVL